MYMLNFDCLCLIIDYQISAGSGFSSRETVIDRRQRSKRSHVQFDTRSYVRRGWAFVWGVPTAGRSFSPIFSVPTIVPVCPSWNHLDPACQPRWRAQKLLNERWRHEASRVKSVRVVPVRVNRFHPLSFLFAPLPAVQPPPSVFFALVPESVSCLMSREIRIQLG